MKPKTMVFLIVALAACLAFVVGRSIYRGGTGRAGEASEAGRTGVFQPAPIGAKELSIASADGATITFAKVDGDWMIREPIDAKAERFKVARLVSAVTSSPAEPIAGDEALGNAVTGLASPPWTIKLTDERGRAHTLAVGNAVPMSGGAKTYVRDEGSGQIFAVQFDFAELLASPMSEWRDRSLWDISRGEIVRVAIAGRDSYELLAGGDAWRVVAPRIDARADEGAVTRLLDKLTALTISEFVSDAPAGSPRTSRRGGLAAYGLDRPQLIVTLTLRGEPPASAPATQATQPGRTVALAIGSKAGGGVFAQLSNSPSVFELPASVLDDLQPSLFDVRDKSLLMPAEKPISRVEVVNPAGQAALTLRDGQWRMEIPHAGRANQHAVEQLIAAATKLTAVRFYDEVPALAAYGLDQPRCKVTLHAVEDAADSSLPGRVARATWVEVGGESPSGDMTFVRSSDGGAVAAVRTADVQRLLDPPCTYWDAVLLNIPAREQPRALEVTRGDVQYRLAVDHAGEWRLAAPIDASADSQSVDKLLTALRNVTAQRIVALGPDVPPGFAEAAESVTVTLTTAAAIGPPPAELTDTAPAAEQPSERARAYTLHAVSLAGPIYAWVEGGDLTAVGQMAPALWDVLTAELRDRAVGSPADADVRRISITRDGKELLLERVAERWTCSADPHVTISGTKVDAFLQNARLLKAERFAAHTEVEGGQFGLDSPRLVVELATADGTTAYRLTVSADGPASGQQYASADSVAGVFVLSEYSVRGLSKSFDDFK